MQHYPKMTTEYPAKSEEFRRVLWTGESSQLVEMTIPVGGDIGEEVSPPLTITLTDLLMLIYHGRPTS